ncbi:cytidylyltransferase domain-containing protein [Colwellia sp. MEBiC06753]
MQNIVAIVQARMGSSRLPGKVMKPLADQPMIGLLLNRLQQAKLINQVVLATSTNEENDVLCQYVESLGIQVYRGSEDDVLSRFSQAAALVSATDVVRITGDSPLLDPRICDRLISYYQQHNADYAYLSAQFAEGVDCEVISANTLCIANEDAQKGSEREHVTLYAYNHANKFKVMELPNASDDSLFRFTVDNTEDFEVVSKICQHFGDSIYTIDTEAIKSFLISNPKVMEINSHIIRNEGLQISLEQDKSANNYNG